MSRGLHTTLPVSTPPTPPLAAVDDAAPPAPPSPGPVPTSATSTPRRPHGCRGLHYPRQRWRHCQQMRMARRCYRHYWYHQGRRWSMPAAPTAASPAAVTIKTSSARVSRGGRRRRSGPFRYHGPFPAPASDISDTEVHAQEKPLTPTCFHCDRSDASSDTRNTSFRSVRATRCNSISYTDSAKGTKSCPQRHPQKNHKPQPR